MDLKQLRYFTTIAEMGQITSAAKKLYIAQPALSHSIKLLEDELGVQLFERLPSGIRITGAGSLLLQKSYEILNRVDSISVDLAEFKDGISGTLNIGMVSSSGSTFINKVFFKFRQHYPDVKFNLYEGNSFEIIDYVKRGIIEIGIVRTPFDESGFAQIKGPATPMVAVTQSNIFPFDSNKKISINDLNEYPLIINRRYYSMLENIHLKEQVTLNFYCLNNDARTTLYWAKAGLGIGIVPKEVVEMLDYTDVTFSEIDHPDLYTCLDTIWLPNRPLSKIGSEFLSYLAD